jgi:hypothetical protein
MEVIEKQQPEEKSKGDMLVNNLIYKQPKALSLAVNRTLKRQYFQKSTYGPNETSVCDWNTGSDYVNSANSYLTFVVDVEGGTSNFGLGSALNLIERIVITSRSGTELDRLERANLFNKQISRMQYSKDWLNGQGSTMGFGNSGLGAIDTDEPGVRGYVIPLDKICGFFRPTNGQMIPPQLAAGLQIQITFADHRTALYQKTGTVTGYTISNISFMTDCVTLSDDTQKSLNMESAKTGLEYTYDRVHTSTSSVLSSNVNVQVRKAVSQANTAHAVLLTQANTQDVTKDSFASTIWDIEQWSYRLGGLHFPHQPISSAYETLHIANNTYDKTRHPHSENSIAGGFFTDAGMAELSASLEKSQHLNLSGMPLNNSRVLELDARLATYTEPLECVLFLTYTCVSRAYLDNTLTAI